MGLFRRLWEYDGLCVTIIFNTAGVRRLITNLFYENQEGIYLTVDSVDSKSNENPA
ncbi:hypothetical protein [Bacteroides sp. ET336]|uniref:hypothetical protein n=1 Tax=Bacteroides sp. ET336 TaxID=2972459 RepID=UPI0021AC4EF9|nr:hypothetical protein [Bacteroides sp. ET336]MCR8892229.1 hypothetical protein [Bacteroides sp. ET336]MDN0056726.1 hypothetical protein [Bacteroides caecigallinarum]